MRVCPPTMIISSMSFGRSPASESACLTGAIVRSIRSPVSCSRMARAAGVGGDERQVDLSLDQGRKLHLSLLAGLFQPLQRGSIGAQVDAGLALELSR